ncbi:MAG TPA: hypothetical protein VK395_37210, partial [Gemmataceae bacterium]|nr:hypothetical protein [Gemmataceae bacterium]
MSPFWKRRPINRKPQLQGSSPRGKDNRKWRPQPKLQIELLEDRTLLSVIPTFNATTGLLTVNLTAAGDATTITENSSNEIHLTNVVSPNDFSGVISIDVEGNGAGSQAVTFGNTITLGGSLTAGSGIGQITFDPSAGIVATGAVILQASDTESGLLATGSAQILVTSATIQGSSVDLSASSSLTANQTNTIQASGVSISGIDAKSDATITIGGSSQITSKSGDLTIAATSTVQATAIAVASQSGATGVDADSATNIIESSALANVSGSSSLSAFGKLSVTATNDPTLTTTADGSGSGASAAGGSVAVATLTGNTQAYIDSTVTASANEIDITAESTRTLNTTAKSTAGGATQNDQSPQTTTDGNANTSGSPVQVAGAIAVASISGSTQAYVDASGLVSATQAININSLSSTDATTVADGTTTAAGNSSVGVGVAVAVNVGNVNSQSYIDGADLKAAAINIQAGEPVASPTNLFSAQATSGAGDSSKVTVAGALAVNVVGNDNEATIQGVDTFTGNPNVSANADNTTTDTAEAQPGAIDNGGNTGVGASIAVNVPSNTATASVPDGVQLTGANELTLGATSNDSTTTTASAGASGKNAVGGAIAITVQTNTTTAQLGTLAGTQDLGGALQVTATHTGTNTTTADGTAVGGNVGIGAAIALNIANDTTTATTMRSVTAGGAVSFTATASAASGASATAGSMGADSTQTSSSGQ